MIDNKCQIPDEESACAETSNEELRAEYHFDYSKARPNRFAGRTRKNVVVVLDDDVAQTFTTPEAVNNALCALITAAPQATQ